MFWILITTKVLKPLANNIILKLIQIINASFRLPQVFWKVIIILKLGNLHLRLDRIYLFYGNKRIIKQRNFVPKRQFGFRNAHSTLDQVHHNTNHNTWGKNVCTVVFLDVSQAFNKATLTVYSQNSTYKSKGRTALYLSYLLCILYKFCIE